MTAISYQVLFTDKKDFKKELASLLKDAIENNSNTELQEDFMINSVKIKYIKQVDEYKYLVGFDLIPEEFIEGLELIIESFNANLEESDWISLIIKLYDEELFSRLLKMYKKIFEVEMKLREVVTLIFIDTYKSDYYNLLKDLNIKTKIDSALQKNEINKREFLSKNFENEFFHILFSDYIALSKPRDLKHEDLFSIASSSSDFEEFKNNILNRGITNSLYKNFIEEIKEIMANLEKVRNCVAHNRTPPSEDDIAYEKYIEEIDDKIKLFFIKINETEKE